MKLILLIIVLGFSFHNCEGRQNIWMGTFDARLKTLNDILIVGLDDFYEDEEIMKLANEKRTSLRLGDTFYHLFCCFISECLAGKTLTKEELLVFLRSNLDLVNLFAFNAIEKY